MSTTTTTSLFDSALRYAAAGLSVFPLRPRGKTPLLAAKDGGQGFRDATTDPEQIRAWWTTTPQANIGIRPPARTLILDVDPRAGGHHQLDRLIDRHGALPETWTAATGGGGRHYWMIAALDPSRTRGQLAPGIDIKTHTSGYVVAPPSIHPNGTAYRWQKVPGHRPAQAPQWLMTLSQHPPRRRHPNVATPAGGRHRYTLGCLVARINGAPEGRRNVTFYGALKDAAADNLLDTAQDVLADAARHNGLTDTEISATIASVRRAGAGRQPK